MQYITSVPFRANLNSFLGINIINSRQAIPYIANDEYFCLENKSERSYHWTGLSTFIAIMFGILGFFIALGTVVDVLRTIFNFYKEDKSSKSSSFGMKMILSFSLYSNLLAIMSTNQGGKDALTCLHGMRFISMTWVVLGHNFVFMGSANFDNAYKLNEFYTGGLGLAFQAVGNALPSVDSFFLMR